jgi:lysine 2,3-aminomutase
LLKFLAGVLPARIPHPPGTRPRWEKIQTREDFLADVEAGMKAAPMSVRLTPHILSVADWSDPLQNPIRRQFIPLASTIASDHPALELDSLHETDDSPVPGLVHRYPDKVLFLGMDMARPSIIVAL